MIKNIKNSNIKNISIKIKQRHILTIIAIATLVCVFLSISIIERSSVDKLNIHSSNSNSNEELTKSFSDAESIQLDIAFNSITTPYKKYDYLRDSCNKYMESGVDNTKTELETKVEINETTYVDEKENISDINNSSKDNNMHEAGVIYFQDKILITYISETGEMQIVASKFETLGTQTHIVTCGRNDIQKLLLNNTIKNNNIQTYNEIISEEQYITNIVNILLQSQTIDSNENNEEFKKNSLKYFNEECYNNITDINNRLIVLDNNTKILVAEAGKSEAQLEYKDRIFIQIYACNNITSIIIKIDDMHKIFDIDIV